MPDEALPPVQQAVPPPPPAPPPPDPAVARLQADLDGIRQTVQNLRQPPSQPQGGPDMAALNRQFYQAPVAASQAIANQAVQDALRQHGAGYMDTLIETAKSQARGTDPAQQVIFDRYEQEIIGRVKLTDPQFHANVNVWRSAFDMVRGAHIADIIAAARPPEVAAPAIHISPGSGPGAPNNRQAAPPASAGSKLSADEKEIATNLGLSHDQYARGKDLYANQASRGKSSFDEVITFSSNDKRRVERAKRRAAAGAK